ncbi:MAPEG family protein [Sporobolomyces koalae]|uniref:MAPEG family protein n=1 Tax=Sporobolomyces koalae TaxID=500713 RepID=UPI00317574AA
MEFPTNSTVCLHPSLFLLFRFTFSSPDPSMSTNYSFYAIPAMWATSIGAHFYAAALTKASNDLPDFDNVAPRDFLRRVQNQEKQSEVVKKYIRAEAAQQNGFENWAIFAGAVIAGNLAKLPTSYMNVFSSGYILSRILYNILYINTTSAAWSNVRSVVYVGGIASLFTTFIKAGNALNRVALF